MNILTMKTMVRPVAIMLLPLLMAYLVVVPVVAQERASEKGRLEHARWYLEGDVVVITYDLIGDLTLTYDVSIVLRRESDPSFKVVPRSVWGAIGKGKHAGGGREIRWEYKRDVSQVLEGSDYMFEFEIRVVGEEGGSNLLYYLVGGLGVAGGVVGLVLGGKKGGTSSPVVSGLPNPPVDRPPSQ